MAPSLASTEEQERERESKRERKRETEERESERETEEQEREQEREKERERERAVLEMCLVDDTLACRGSGSRTSRVATHNNRQIESPRTAFSIYVDIRNRTHKHADTGPPLES